MEGGDVHGEAKEADTMTILHVGAHTKVYDGASEADAWDRSINQLEPSAVQSNRTPPPGV